MSDFFAALRADDHVRLVIDSVPGFVAFFSPDLRYQLVNESYEVRFGCKGEDLYGRTIRDVWGDIGVERFQPLAEQAIRTRQTVTKEVQANDVMAISSFVPHVLDGEVRAVMLVSQDISELRATRDALVRAERMASLGRLVAGLLHEINNPAGVVTSALATIRSALSKELDDRRRQKLITLADTALLASQRISDTSQRLRTFSRIDQAETQHVDLKSGMEATVGLLGPELSGVEIRWDWSDLIECSCRPGEINQVFMALLSNAAAVLGGSGTVTVRGRRDGEDAVIEVEDDGPGISAERLDTIFEPAFAIHGGRTRAGIGLFVSRSIIEAHHGRLDVSTRPEGGACFTIRLPAAAL